jgi:hypothetical protein
MGERVTISYRGAAYELGRGKRCYAIWAAGAPRTEPVERWPETPDGWVAAWTRFTEVETPGTIVPAGRVPSQSGPEPGMFSGPGDFAGSRPGDVVTSGRQTPGWLVPGAAGPAFAAALLGIGVICGLVGLFTHYQGGLTLASQPASLVPHVAYLAVWTLAALLIVLRAGTLARAGALLAVGTSVVTFGLFGADLGQGLSLADAGLWISLVGWLACTVGAVLAVLSTGITAGRGTIGKPDARGLARAGLLIVAGVGVALSYFPNWDSYLLRSSTTGQTEIGGGFAFGSTIPGWVQAFDVAIMVLFVLVVVIAALWRPVAAGAMLLAGAAIPMGAQAISGMVQASEPTSPTVFGISAGDAQQLGLTITNGLTPAFWVYCLFVVTLLVSCAWMLLSPPARPGAGPGLVPVTGPSGAEVTEPDAPAGPVAEPPSAPVAEPLSGPVTGLFMGQPDDVWTERELAADSRDDKA